MPQAVCFSHLWLGGNQQPFKCGEQMPSSEGLQVFVVVKKSAHNAGDGSIPGEDPWRRRQPTPVELLSGENSMDRVEPGGLQSMQMLEATEHTQDPYLNRYTFTET